MSVAFTGWGGAYWSSMAKPFMRYVRLRMTYHDYKSEAKRPDADEEPRRLQPQALDIPDVSSNTWRNSWRKHMVEYMYANGTDLDL